MRADTSGEIYLDLEGKGDGAIISDKEVADRDGAMFDLETGFEARPGADRR